jgi:MscS family membrane protein
VTADRRLNTWKFQTDAFHPKCAQAMFTEGSGRNWRTMPNRTNGLGLAFIICLLIGSAAHSHAQLPTSARLPQPPKVESGTEPATRIDPLGRETPRSAFIGLLISGERADYENAARYLQPPSERNANLPERAREFRALQGRFKSSINLLSDDPNGTIEPGLSPGQVRVGVWSIGGTTVDVILVRVDDPTSGKIWLISKETVARIPELYAQLDAEAPTLADRIMPGALTGRRLFGLSLAQWIEWLVSIPVSWSLAWLLAFVLSLPARIRCKLRKLPFTPLLEPRIVLPIKCITAILVHTAFVYQIKPPLLYRVYYFRLMATLFVGCFVWLLSVVTDRGFEHAVNQTRIQNKGQESAFIVMQRLTHIILVIIALLIALALFGLNVTTALAGFGIGGLAIALAAKETLENLIGGISLLMDKAVHVGDFCQIGNQFGTVEDFGLRSLKLRTLDQTLLVIPNGALAKMQFGNLTHRRKFLISQNFALRIETEVEQLRFVLDRIQRMLDQHPAVERGTSRVRVTNLIGAAFALELIAYGRADDWARFTGIRQDVILKMAEIVKASGTRFAAPTQLAYMSRDTGVDADKTNDVVRRMTELRASDTFRFPGEAPTGTD